MDSEGGQPRYGFSPGTTLASAGPFPSLVDSSSDRGAAQGEGRVGLSLALRARMVGFEFPPPALRAFGALKATPLLPSSLLGISTASETAGWFLAAVGRDGQRP